MRKKTVVISLGGSQIIPEKVNYVYLKKFREIVLDKSDKFNFIIVCGGGTFARRYIEVLKKDKKNEYMQSLAGIAVTRTNARFLSYFFGYDPKMGIPHTQRTLKKYLKKKGIVFCGALEYKDNQTSDSVAALLAKKFKAPFINLTNVKGLYNKDPTKYKDAKFISKISWKDFHSMIEKINFKPGQHFVLDQNASKTIMAKKIPTYILKDLKELDNFLESKPFVGTIISD